MRNEDAHPSMRYAQLARDTAAFAALAILALAAGLALNRFRAEPLPLLYQSQEQRLDAQLNQLIHAPVFQVTPANFIGLDEFRSLVDGRRALIIDARAEPFYAQGHVPGALNLSREDFVHDYRRLGSTLANDRDRQIVVYCSGQDCHDSRMVASALLSLGFQRVEVFTGGFEAWSRAGMPVSRK